MLQQKPQHKTVYMAFHNLWDLLQPSTAIAASDHLSFGQMVLPLTWPMNSQ